MNKCALVVGHSKNSPGAYNKRTGQSEYHFNNFIAHEVKARLPDLVEIVYRDDYKSLPSKINGISPGFIISLHCNAFDGKVSGSEVLYYHSSKKGKELATLLLDNILQAIELPNRGIKPKETEDRGGYLLRYTAAPCVISEPFFIDNLADMLVANKRSSELVSAYCDTILQYSQR